jgi:hypothetical protein
MEAKVSLPCPRARLEDIVDNRGSIVCQNQITRKERRNYNGCLQTFFILAQLTDPGFYICRINDGATATYPRCKQKLT